MITIGFAPHYIETLPYARNQMHHHQLIVLEEPPSADFEKMLRGELPIEDCILAMDSAFPEFDRQMYAVLRDLHRGGKRIIQIEPYLEGLLRIHELFDKGKTPEEILRMPSLGAVYSAEREATAALLRYYAASAKSFETVVESVKVFAQSDARRFNMRAKMRGEAIAKLDYKGSIYVEAGSMHYPLYRHLQQRLRGGTKVRIVFLLDPLLRRLHARRRNLGPGDVLTLLYVFHPRINDRLADLLAARSLIYVKIISKSELKPGISEAPHSEEEVQINRLVDQLDYEDCRELFDQIKSIAVKEDAFKRVQSRIKEAKIPEMDVISE